MVSSVHLDVGAVSIRQIPVDPPPPQSPSEWSDWGERDPALTGMQLERWLVELTPEGGSATVVGDLSAHPVWYGPNPSSRAMNMGISLIEAHRGKGIGTAAQQLLAEELHDRGIVRVEASTDVANIAEQRSLKRAGFAYEGTLRMAQGRRDGLHDLEVWSHVRVPGSPDSPTSSELPRDAAPRDRR